MPKVYSETFINRANESGWFIYNVPVGKRAVVRNVVVVDRLAVTGHAEVHAHLAIVALVIFPAAQRSVSLDMRAVVYGGQSIECFVGVVGIDLMVAGYLFDDAPAVSVLPAPPPADPGRPPPDTVIEWPAGP